VSTSDGTLSADFVHLRARAAAASELLPGGRSWLPDDFGRNPLDSTKSSLWQTGRNDAAATELPRKS
jgi:hypothetical protein